MGQPNPRTTLKQSRRVASVHVSRAWSFRFRRQRVPFTGDNQLGTLCLDLIRFAQKDCAAAVGTYFPLQRVK